MAGLFAEALDATQGNRARAPRVLLDILEVEEILSEFFLGDHVRGGALVLRQLAHSPDVHLRRPGRQAPELKTLDHALAPLGHGYTAYEVGNRSHRKYRSTGLATA